MHITRVRCFQASPIYHLVTLTPDDPSRVHYVKKFLEAVSRIHSVCLKDIEKPFLHMNMNEELDVSINTDRCRRIRHRTFDLPWHTELRT